MSSIPDPARVERFRSLVYGYYRRCGRHDLEWRNTRDPYRVLVSEFMLQQTQVVRVRDKYREFLTRFPSIAVLARAGLRDVLGAWSGLGYNRRARFLHELARRVNDEFDGKLPGDREELRSLPGVGAYTASAVACFAFGTPLPLLETNVRRALIYTFFAEPERKTVELFAAEEPGIGLVGSELEPRRVNAPVHDRDVLRVAETVLDRQNPREWNYALMDFGELIGRRVPNPNRASAHYTRQSRFEGSLRQARGAAIRVLTSVATADAATIADQCDLPLSRIESALNELSNEGLVAGDGTGKWTIC